MPPSTRQIRPETTPATRLFFFFLLRRPQRSTLFPYTTLFRSYAQRRAPCPPRSDGMPRHRRRPRVRRVRSEEHTSELQSLRHLVCRLLLEKKKAGCSRKDQQQDAQADKADRLETIQICQELTS